MRTCEVNNCNNFVFGTDKLTRTGYCKNHQTLRTDISHESIMQRALKKQRETAAKNATSKIAKLPESKAPKDYKSKSQLLKDADRLFGDFIKNRDKDKNSQAKCPCCGKDVLVEVNGKFNPDCNVMHFIDRDVYLLRFDEDAAATGHSWCNRNQHFNPSGIEYQNFKQHLIDKFGEQAVAEMEVAKRKINKITEQQLKNIIEHYSQI